MLAVVGLSFVLLMVVFRSVFVPLKAAIMNLLSIGAAYGAIIAVFQWGWGKGLIGLEDTIPVNPFVPLIMFAILFGLSMDYEVFLLSRVREEFLKTGDSHRSVVEGLGSTARVITSAALIMISVFGAFIWTDDVVGQDVRPRPRRRRPRRRHHRPHGPGPGDDGPPRQRQLVAAEVARPDPAAPRPRGRTDPGDRRAAGRRGGAVAA